MNDQSLPPFLHSFACYVRTALEKARSMPRDQYDPINNFPTGCCGQVSELLGIILVKQFRLDAKYVFGRKYLPKGNGFQTHAWISVGGIILDVTADQFGEPPIIVTRESAWHNGWEDIEVRAPVLDLDQMKLVSSEIYDALIKATQHLQHPKTS